MHDPQPTSADAVLLALYRLRRASYSHLPPEQRGLQLLRHEAPVNITKLMDYFDRDDDETTVISSGQTAKETLDAAREEGYADPILTRVPSKLG